MRRSKETNHVHPSSSSTLTVGPQIARPTRMKWRMGSEPPLLHFSIATAGTETPLNASCPTSKETKFGKRFVTGVLNGPLTLNPCFPDPVQLQRNVRRAKG